MDNKELLKHVLYINNIQAKNYDEANKISLNNKKISTLLIKDFINNEEYYNHIINLINKGLSNLIIRKKDNNRVTMYQIITRAEIIKSILLLSQTNEFNEIAKERIKKIYELTSYKAFKDKYYNELYTSTIDNNEYSIKVSDFINILSLPTHDFINLCQSNKDIIGIKKEIFIYAAMDFINKNNILKNYIVPENMAKNIELIQNKQLIDIEVINKITHIIDNNANNVIVNNELKQTIYKNMPQDLTPLEKTIYIYIKLCKTLSYDEKYYLNKEGKDALIHKDINYIHSITPNNNNAICYELNAIYSSFLKELGINYQKKATYEEYGEGHEELEFRYDKFIIAADTVKTVFNSDLVQAKINEKLEGLFCKNKNKQTIMEFNSIVKKVYSKIIINENDTTKFIENEPTFEDILEEYSNLSNQHTSISIEDKLDILITIVNNKHLNSLDCFAFLLKKARIIFENDNSIAITIIKNNINNKACAIITHIIDQDNYKYYIYNPNEELIPISNNDIQTKFSNKEYEIINLNLVPGIDIRGRKL